MFATLCLYAVFGDAGLDTDTIIMQLVMIAKPFVWISRDDWLCLVSSAITALIVGVKLL